MLQSNTDFTRDGMLFVPSDDEEAPRSAAHSNSDPSHQTLSSDSVVQTLSMVRGIGEKYAKELVSKGIKSISDVADSPDVPEHIRLCAKYFDDLQAGISKAIATVLFAHIDSIILRSNEVNQQIKAIYPVGSYRRDHTHLKDLDILAIFDPPTDAATLASSLDTVISREPLFRGKLSMGSNGYEFLYSIRDSKNQPAKLDHKLEQDPLSSIPTAPSRVCVVEIYLASSIEVGAALLYLTGPKEFNILLRKRAKSKNMLLNQYGLFRLDDVHTIIARNTENEIFEALGLPYMTPLQRDDHEIWKTIS